MNILLPGLEIDTNYAVQVRPGGPENKAEDWSPIFYFKTATDTNPPPKPSKPILSNSLGTIVVEWDGKDDEGNSMFDVAPDTTAVEVHASTMSGFTPSAGTLSGHIMRVGNDGGKWIVSRDLPSDPEHPLPYATDIFIKLVAVDSTNLVSPPSDEANAQFLRVSGLDIEGGTIGPDKVSFDISGGNIGIISPTEPSASSYRNGDGFIEGDTWIDTSAGAAGSVMKTWSGSAWVATAWNSAALGPNSVTATQLAAGSIAAGSAVIGTGAIARANIADAAIDDAKIANVQAGKITTGTLNAGIIVGNYIATATSGARAVLNTNGFYLYGSSGQNTVSFNSSNGNASITGTINATLFRSVGTQTSGQGYVEIGQTGPVDPNDEIRMFSSGGYVSSIRNPSDSPGVLRVSTYQYGASRVFDFGYYGLSVGRINATSYLDANIQLNTNGIYMFPYDGGGYALKTVGVYDSGNYNLKIGPNSGGGSGTGTIKFLRNSPQVQVRNLGDTGYATLAAIIADQSSPELKDNITELNIDAVKAVSQVKLRAWDWKNDDVDDKKRLPGVGLLTDDLPAWMLIGDGYHTGTLLATCAQAIGELNQRIEQLESRLTNTE